MHFKAQNAQSMIKSIALPGFIDIPLHANIPKAASERRMENTFASGQPRSI